MSKRNNCPGPKIWFVVTIDRFRFADARWPEQQKTSARTARFRQAEFAALHRRDDARQHLGLAADFARQQRVQFVEFGELRRVRCFVHPLPLAGTSLHVVYHIHQRFLAFVRLWSRVRRKSR